jgi:hypothetical protein
MCIPLSGYGLLKRLLPGGPPVCIQVGANIRRLRFGRFHATRPRPSTSRSSRGPGQCPLTAPTGVRIPYGTPNTCSYFNSMTYGAQRGVATNVWPGSPALFCRGVASAMGGKSQDLSTGPTLPAGEFLKMASRDCVPPPPNSMHSIAPIAGPLHTKIGLTCFLGPTPAPSSMALGQRMPPLF